MHAHLLARSRPPISVELQNWCAACKNCTCEPDATAETGGEQRQNYDYIHPSRGVLSFVQLQRTIFKLVTRCHRPLLESRHILLCICKLYFPVCGVSVPSDLFTPRRLSHERNMDGRLVFPRLSWCFVSLLSKNLALHRAEHIIRGGVQDQHNRQNQKEHGKGCSRHADFQRSGPLMENSLTHHKRTPMEECNV